VESGRNAQPRKGVMGKEEPRTSDTNATPVMVATAIVMLEEDNKWRAGELLTAYGSIATKTTTTRPLQRQQT
jgi:hypothetical protein